VRGSTTYTQFAAIERGEFDHARGDAGA